MVLPCGFKRSTGALSVFLFATSFSLAETVPSTPEVDSLTLKTQSVFEHSQSAIARITAVDDYGKLSGTGFFVDPAGTLYTAFSIGGTSRDILVHVGPKTYVAKRLLSDARSGIAILKIDAVTDFLPRAPSGLPPIASPVMTVGYPMERPATPSLGLIGGYDRMFTNRYFTTTHIRANIPVQRGQGGAPLLDLNGRVLGILISEVDGGGACHVLPISAAEKVRANYMHYGEVRHGWIGVKVGEQLGASPQSSAVIEAVEESTPAKNSGLQSGDVLVRVGNVEVSEPEDVLDGSFFLTAGEDVELEVLRNGERLVFIARPELYQPSGSDVLSKPAVESLDSPAFLRLRPVEN